MFLWQKDDNINNDYSHLTCFIDKQMFAVESVNCSTVSSAVHCTAKQYREAVYLLRSPSYLHN